MLGSARLLVEALAGIVSVPVLPSLFVVLGVALTTFRVPRSSRNGRSGRVVATSTLLAAAAGAFIGLLIGVLLAFPLSALPGRWGDVSPAAVGLGVTALSALLAVSREHDLAEAFRVDARPAGRSGNGQRMLLDTSAIIDGRIADISQTGFIQGTLVIPRFVLDELRRVADSSDALRRNRGRRGLDMLNKLQKESDVPIEIVETDYDETTEVDAKLVRLGQALRCPIITNDFNLNRVAELQGVRVLNINALSNAVKTVVLPGEEMAVKVIQEGREAGQGVGFLDDGTMVVVEGGKRYINGRLDIIVTRVLQTAAGRMIFAHPR